MTGSTSLLPVAQNAPPGNPVPKGCPMSITSVGPQTHQTPPASPAPASPSAPAAAAKTAEEAAPAKTEASAVQVSLSSQNTANPALKVNSDGTIGPHHKGRHPHAHGQTSAQAPTAAAPAAQTLPGSIKV